MSARHPQRFQLERQQAAEFRRHRDVQGNPPAADSPVVRAELVPIAPPQVEQAAIASLTREAQAQIEQVLGAPMKREPWQVRHRFPGGWITAPYVAVPKALRLALSQVPVLYDVVEGSR